MEKLHIKLEIVEIGLTVFLIGLLIYFHVEEGKQHKEMIDAITGKTEKETKPTVKQ